MRDQVDWLCEMLGLTGALSFEEVCKAAVDRLTELEAQARNHDRLIAALMGNLRSVKTNIDWAVETLENNDE
jgi:hypothetical protein